MQEAADHNKLFQDKIIEENKQLLATIENLNKLLA